MLPNLRATIDRRLLLNLRVRPEYWTETKRLPERLRPVTIDGWSVAGVCFLRLRGAAPRWLPGTCGLATEGAALRVACVDQENNDARCVAILRRWTNSSLIGLTDYISPMCHSVMPITSNETGQRFDITVGKQCRPQCQVNAERSDAWPKASLFDSPSAAS